jgi:hypothetical protein
MKPRLNKKNAPAARPRRSSTALIRKTDNRRLSKAQVKSFPEEAKKINQLHASVLKHARHALDEAIQIGGLLGKVKDKLEHGQWLPWLEANVPFTIMTANQYLRCFENREQLKLKNVLSLSEAYRLMAGTGQRQKRQESDAEQTQPEPREEPESGSKKPPVKNIIEGHEVTITDDGVIIGPKVVEPQEPKPTQDDIPSSEIDSDEAGSTVTPPPEGKPDKVFGRTRDQIWLWFGNKVKAYFSVMSDRELIPAKVAVLKALLDDEELGGEPELKYPDNTERSLREQLGRRR